MTAANSVMPREMRSIAMCSASATRAKLPVHQPPTSSTAKTAAVSVKAAETARSGASAAWSSWPQASTSAALPELARDLVEQHGGRAGGVEAVDAGARLRDR